MSFSFLRRVAVGWAMVAASVAQSPVRPFDAATVVLEPRAQFAALLDVDADGDMDAVDVFPQFTSGYDVRIRRNDGAGNFAVTYSQFIAGPPSNNTIFPKAARADLNADGFDDFVVAGGTDVQYFLSDGAGGALYAGGVTLTTPSIGALATGDADGDGDDDVVVGGAFGAELRRNDAGASAATLGVFAGFAGINLASAAIGVAAGEFTGDAGVDFAATFNGTNADTLVGVFRYDGVGLVLHQLHGLGAIQGCVPVAGDVDGDGDLDVLAVGSLGFFGLRYQVLRRISPTTLSLEPTPIGSGGFSRLADVDQDGDLDGVGMAPRNTSAPNPSDFWMADFHVALNTGGVLGAPYRLPCVGRTAPVGVADLDGDGDVELVGGRSIYFGRGAFQPPLFAAPNYSSLATTRYPYFVADYDSDGDPDYDFGYSTSAPSTRRNDGAGEISAVLPPFPSPPAGRTFAGPGFAGDFDGDGDVDLLVEEIAATGYFATRLLKNTGGGHFSPAVSCIPPGERIFTTQGGLGSTISAAGALTGDIDGDGDLDLVARWLFSGNATRIWVNGGTGFFSPVALYNGEYAVACRDLNADGMADLLTVQTGAGLALGAVALRFAVGGGAFGPATVLPGIGTGGLSFDVEPAFADFDDDGDVDWATWVVVGTTFELKVFWNDGAGGFPAALTVESGADSGRRAFAADVDGDGAADLLHEPSVPSGSPDVPTVFLPENSLRHSIVVRRRTGPATFDSPIEQVLAPVAFADVDGDGDLDAVGKQVSRNLRYDGPFAGVRVQYGQGFAGTGGVVPVIGDVGPFRPGSSGVLRLRGGRGGAEGLLILGGTMLDLPTPVGGNLYASLDLLLPITLSGPVGAAGRGSYDLPWTLPPGIEGYALFHQFAIADPGAAFGIAATGGLRVTFGG